MTVRLHLRDATRVAHERTDAAFSALDLERREDYHVFLASHLLAYRSLEPVFARGLPPALRPPVMSGLLADDLHALGYDAPKMPLPDFAGDALGSAYVVAGSHFGQRVLSRRQSRSTDPQVRGAGRYLASFDLRTYWPVLQNALEEAGTTPERANRLSDGAASTFALFADCLTLARREGACHEFA